MWQNFGDCYTECTLINCICQIGLVTNIYIKVVQFTQEASWHINYICFNLSWCLHNLDFKKKYITYTAQSTDKNVSAVYLILTLTRPKYFSFGGNSWPISFSNCDEFTPCLYLEKERSFYKQKKIENLTSIAIFLP